jgi:nucleoside-diphosphate kinase
MSSHQERVYGFVVEWFDNQAALARKYIFKYYLLNGEIEMFDMKSRRTFLKRSPVSDVQLEDLYVGGTVTIHSRLLKIVDYSDPFTKNAIAKLHARVICVVKGSGLNGLPNVLNNAKRAKLHVRNLRMVRLSPQEAAAVDGKDGQSLVNQNVVAIEFVGESPAEKAAQFLQGIDSVCTSDPSVSNLLFRNARLPSPAQYNNCTVAVIKPHAFTSGHTGQILAEIQASGFEISAMQLFTLDQHASAEFLDVYKTVVPEYNKMVAELQSGPCIALELRGDDAVGNLRALCGPWDPSIAQHIRPKTLRAQFGQDRVRNGVHCTDLPEDGPLESEFFFQIVYDSICE